MVRPMFVLVGLGITLHAIYIYRNPVRRLNAIMSIDEIEENPEGAKRSQRRFGIGFALLYGSMGLMLLIGGLFQN